MKALFLICWLLFSMTEGYAAPRRAAYEEGPAQLRQMQDSIDAIKHEVANHEVELKTLEERLNNGESRLESFHEQMTENAQAQKELLKENSTSLEERIIALESSQKNVTGDLRQFKNHANETSSNLGQYQKRILELEKVVEVQNKNIDHLQAALQSLVEIMQVKSKGEEGVHSYTVKAGDNLEKIAKANNTTIQAIKEANGLNKDQIKVGQILKLP